MKYQIMNHPKILIKKNKNNDDEKKKQEMREGAARYGISYFIGLASSKRGQENPHHIDVDSVAEKYALNTLRALHSGSSYGQVK